MSTATTYLAGQKLDDAQLQALVDQFDRDGYLFLENVLPPDWVAELREDLDRALAEKPDQDNSSIQLRTRLFEISRANVRLFDMEPIVSFAEAVLGNNCHVVHNNAFRSPPGGGISGWHQDDPPHFLVTEGEPPTNIKLPCLLFSCNYYLTDVDDVSQGPFQGVRGSHLIGQPCPPDPTQSKWADRMFSCLGKAGSVTIFNNQLWHRGAPNTSDRTRAVTQVSYGRRLIGHKYYPFMNYVMPEHVYADANPRLKRLLGFLPSGAYG